MKKQMLANITHVSRGSLTAVPLGPKLSVDALPDSYKVMVRIGVDENEEERYVVRTVRKSQFVTDSDYAFRYAVDAHSNLAFPDTAPPVQIQTLNYITGNYAVGYTLQVEIVYSGPGVPVGPVYYYWAKFPQGGGTVTFLQDGAQNSYVIKPEDEGFHIECTVYVPTDRAVKPFISKRVVAEPAPGVQAEHRYTVGNLESGDLIQIGDYPIFHYGSNMTAVYRLINAINLMGWWTANNYTDYNDDMEIILRAINFNTPLPPLQQKVQAMKKAVITTPAISA